ncbi:MFS transporter [Nonomuraea sp. NPDC052265]|uniref:MFS transporter n=1 Tax=Nonomuraea sp. NPDC052265 TaxID=3364374 RepID=UPI0037C92715
MLSRYMAGVVAARTGDEMSGPALLVAGLAATGSPLLGASLLAGLTVSAAVGGPLLGVLLDRARRPGRLLAWCLLGYATGLLLVAAGVGRVPGTALVALAMVTGLAGPALTGGWTGQLSLVSGPDRRRLARATALDAMTYNVAGLAGPAAVGVVAAATSGGTAVLVSVALLLAALPAAWSLPARDRPPPAPRPADAPGTRTTTPPSHRPHLPAEQRHRSWPTRERRDVRAATAEVGAGVKAAGVRGFVGEVMAGVRAAVGEVVAGVRGVMGEVVAGVRVVLGNPVLWRATAGSMVSCAGTGMFVVSAPVLGLELSGDSGRGTLLLAVTAAAGLAVNGLLAWRGGRSRRRTATPAWDVTLVWATALVGVGMAVAAVAGLVGTSAEGTSAAGASVAAAYWVAVAAAGLVGAGEGPQLTALFAVRQREAPEGLRSQVFTTGASLKITSFAVGSALAGPLSAHSAATALLAGAASQLVAVCVLTRRRT